MHQFSYPTDLHYSQTDPWRSGNNLQFSYPTDLHYSQTVVVDESLKISLVTLQIYTTLKPEVDENETK